MNTMAKKGLARLFFAVFSLCIASTSWAYPVGDQVEVLLGFTLTGSYQVYSNLAFSNLDFDFKQNGVLIAQGRFDGNVGGTVTKSGVFADLPISGYNYNQQSVNYSFTVPVTVTIGSYVSFDISMSSGMIRGYEDFFSSGGGLYVSMFNNDVLFNHSSTTLYASVSKSSWVNATATAPDQALAEWPDDPYPKALSLMAAPMSYQLSFRPDGAPYVYDYANTRVVTSGFFESPTVPVPPAVLLLGSGILGLFGFRVMRKVKG